MKVFISWSGDKSREVGELLNDWLQCVLQTVKPWISSEDIDKGSLWFSEINDQFKDTSLGIICLTKANKEKPWILFEAGALAKGLSANRICTFLIDLQPHDIKDPLAQFNHTLPIKKDIKKLVKTINASLGEKSLKEKTLDQVFETYWTQFEEKFKEIENRLPDTTPPVENESKDILSEILSLSRNLDKRLRNVENSNRGISNNFQYEVDKLNNAMSPYKQKKLFKIPTKIIEEITNNVNLSEDQIEEVFNSKDFLINTKQYIKELEESKNTIA